MRKMDKVSEAVYFAGRQDRGRKGVNWSRYWENAEKTFPKRKLNIAEDRVEPQEEQQNPE